ncbi:hypothetical protein Bphy_4888 [Paraburkholderia phymatum STM815]|uniref:Uncharacterized protein n=1 Tax=Paraburkholderia phymatum (strain DSM 17167 / CIP 108236 / LMG 21445 / STM815) TaxID=391038 RepID=B2JSH3_PARP8|nr:hypothetical protein Bphy_4888 [Paraburkholderia phymatum STM815]
MLARRKAGYGSCIERGATETLCPPIYWADKTREGTSSIRISVFAPDLKIREQGDVFRLLIKVNTLRKPRSTSFRVCAADAALTLGGLAYIAELAVAKAAGGRAC